MKKDSNLIQKLFGSSPIGSSRVPIRSNIYGNKGFSPIGTTTSKLFDFSRRSPLLGTATPSNTISGYFERLSELRGYQLLDISKLVVNFFSDYIVNFLSDSSNNQTVTILDENGQVNQMATEKINNILSKDIKIFDYVKDHLNDYIFYGGYFSLLQSDYDDTGHKCFRVEELYEPISVVVKRTRGNSTTVEKVGEKNTNSENMTTKTNKISTKEVFLARGEDNSLYEIPTDEIIYLANNNFRLVNDLNTDGEWGDRNKFKFESSRERANKKVKFGENKGKEANKDKVLLKESYFANEPIFYSLILKVKELVIKELLVSLISLRDLSSTQIFMLQFDKGTPIEAANELCARTTKLANSTNELASFLTSQFDAISFIENTLTQSAKFVPDFNSTLGSKNVMLPLDKLSDKLLEIMQTVDQCRNSILGPLGLPPGIAEAVSGTKWQVLQQSERANSRISSIISGIKNSVLTLTCNIYKQLYDTDINPSLVKLHLCEKTSVEFNNQLNQCESVNGLIQSISGILSSSLQTIDMTAPLLDVNAFLTYIQNIIKDIDPNTRDLITEETKGMYMQLAQGKARQMFEQFGMQYPGDQQQ